MNLVIFYHNVKVRVYSIGTFNSLPISFSTSNSSGIKSNLSIIESSVESIIDSLLNLLLATITKDKLVKKKHTAKRMLF